jgi:hypothetical protein
MRFASNSDFWIFMSCLVAGAGVLFKYCLEQFDKPTQSKSENDPWPFIVPKYLASRRQYLVGFSLYFGILLGIFLLFSFLGPDVVAKIFAGIVSAQTIANVAAPAAAPAAAAAVNPIFPIVIAFWLVGINPSLPKFLDVELLVRKLGHRTAYIPTGMNDIFVFMRYTGYSDFVMSERELKEAWSEIGVRPVTTTLDELKPAVELMNHVAFLYGRAATLAGDLNLNMPAGLREGLNIDVFRTYRSDIQRVLTMLQAAHGRIVEQNAAPDDDHSEAVQDIQRDLNRSLEFIYTLFACAITAKGTDALADRLSAFGIIKPYPPKPQIPWNPILKVTIGCGVVMFVAGFLAIQTFIANTAIAQSPGIPRTPGDLAVWLLIAFFVHIVAIALATRTRTRLIDRDKYMSPTGATNISAYMRVLVYCAGASLASYLVLNGLSPINIILSSWGAPLAAFTDPLVHYLQFCAAWTMVPASCGLMTAYTLDLTCETPTQRLQSGVIEASVMGVVAMLAVQFSGDQATTYFRVFNVMVYGGIGFVFGFLLPAAITRHRKALERRLPERIVMLRSAVFRNFLDMEDFNKWLQASDIKLNGRRPLDVLEEESGLQTLIDFVRSRQVVPAAAGV